MATHLKMFTASATERALNCPAHLALPQTPDEESEAARLGTAVHVFVEHALTSGRDEALKHTTRKVPCGRIDLDAIVGLIAGDKFKCEVSFEYDTSAGTCVEVGDYSDSEGVIHGTADLLIFRADGSLELFDFKTGMPVAPAQENAQLGMLATMAATAYNVDRVRVGLLYIDLRSGQVSIDDAQLAALDMAIFSERVRVTVYEIGQAFEAVAIGLLPKVNPGQWCRYCRAKCESRAA